MNVKLLNLIIKAVIILLLIKYTFVIENLMKGDLLTIVSVILIGYYVNNIIPYIEEQFELKNIELTTDTEIKAEAESVVTTIDNVSKEVTNEVTNDINQSAEIVLNEKGITLKNELKQYMNENNLNDITEFDNDPPEFVCQKYHQSIEEMYFWVFFPGLSMFKHFSLNM